MKPTKPPEAHTDITKLRSEAEQRLQQQATPADASHADTLKLVHELQVHQIELEMQKEELIKANMNADEALASYTDLYDFAPVSYLTLDQNGTIKKLNLVAAQMLGTERQKLISQRLGNFVNADDYSNFNSVIDRLFKHKQSKVCLDMALTDKDSNLIYVYLEAKLDKNMEQCHVILLDITERKQLEVNILMSEEKYRHLFENMSQGVVYQSPDGSIIDANLAAQRILGLSLDQLQGRTSFDPRWNTIHEDGSDFPGDTHPAVRALQTGQRVEAVIMGVYHPQKGHYRWISINAIPEFMPGEKTPYRVYAIFEDITKRKQAQDEVYKLNEALEDKVLERTTELEHARTEAESANYAKSDFLAAMSHEIRTPMNGVIGMIDVLQQSNLSEAQLKISSIIHYSAYTLLDIINNILDFSKIEAGKITIDSAPMSLIEAVEGVGDMLVNTVSNNTVTLQIFVDPTLPDQIISDAGRLRQILINLVGNAIKFTSRQTQPGKVSLRTRLLDITGQKVSVEFSITDNGIGMDKATLARLFKPFTQANKSTATKFGGTGLGLVITQQLVDLMGGEIIMNSELGIGTEILVRVAFEVLPQDTDAIKLPPPLAELECLLVGVEDGVADDLAAYLTHAGARTTRVNDGDAARQWLNDCPAGQYLMVFEQFFAELPLADLRATIRSRSDVKVGFVVLGHETRQKGHVESNDMVVLDAGITHRDELITAAGVAIGRISPEVITPKAVSTRKLAIPLTREKAIGLDSLILVAEDNMVNQQVILQQLHLLGRTADVADNGSEALEMWKSGQYSILLTDLNMPEMDGYELCTAIRAAENGKSHLPIIALTANALKGEADHCLKMGMDAYLSKPVQLDTFEAALNKWLPPVDEEAFTYSEPNQENAERTLSAPVDLNVLKALIGDDQKAINKLLHNFRLSAAKIASELRVACDAGQAIVAGSLAHKLKSSARTVGALKLGEICEAMEQAGKAEDMATLSQLLLEFDQELAAVDQYLKEY